VVCSWPLDPESQDVPQFVAKDDTPCEIRCTLQQPIGAVIISSSARYCELRTADQAGAYLATVRGVGEPEGGYGLALDVQVLHGSFMFSMKWRAMCVVLSCP